MSPVHDLPLQKFDFQNLGLSIGARFNATGPLLDFLIELHALCAEHEDCYPVALNHLHFIFLDISHQVFANPTEIPAELRALKPIVTENLKDLEWSLADLQLKWAGKSLTLAGSANYQSNAARTQLVDEILAGPCSTYLKARHSELSIPPTQWQATLLRCQLEIPEPIKARVKKVGKSIFSSIALGTPTLFAANLDCSKTFPISHNQS